MERDRVRSPPAITASTGCDTTCHARSRGRGHEDEVTRTRSRGHTRQASQWHPEKLRRFGQPDSGVNFTLAFGSVIPYAVQQHYAARQIKVDADIGLCTLIPRVIRHLSV